MTLWPEPAIAVHAQETRIADRTSDRVCGCPKLGDVRLVCSVQIEIAVSRYWQIERDLQCGGNGRELPGRAAASAALEICNVALANAGSIGQSDLGDPSPVTNNQDRILSSRDAIGDGLRNGNLSVLVECAACTRDDAAGAGILFGFGGERSQALVLLAGEHREKDT
jgi:hypothetical protein